MPYCHKQFLDIWTGPLLDLAPCEIFHALQKRGKILLVFCSINSFVCRYSCLSKSKAFSMFNALFDDPLQYIFEEIWWQQNESVTCKHILSKCQRKLLNQFRINSSDGATRTQSCCDNNTIKWASLPARRWIISVADQQYKQWASIIPEWKQRKTAWVTQLERD